MCNAFFSFSSHLLFINCEFYIVFANCEYNPHNGAQYVVIGRSRLILIRKCNALPCSTHHLELHVHEKIIECLFFKPNSFHNCLLNFNNPHQFWCKHMCFLMIPSWVAASFFTISYLSTIMYCISWRSSRCFYCNQLMCFFLLRFNKWI
jgi:hypothetical protein